MLSVGFFCQLGHKGQLSVGWEQNVYYDYCICGFVGLYFNKEHRKFSSGR